jgi:hypothetical protein
MISKMSVPSWILRLLPIWEYICPKCRKEVNRNSHVCTHCDERFPLAIRVPPSFLKDPKKLEAYVHQHVFPRISEFERNYLTKYFTVIFSDGFESGDFSAWNSTEGSPVIVSSPTHHGAKAAQGTGSGSVWIAYVPFSPYSDAYFRGYIRFPSVLGAGEYAECMTIIGTEGQQMYLWQYGTTFQLRVPSGDNSISDITITANTWYCIEIRRKVGAGDGVAQLWIDGILKVSKTAETITGNSQMFRSGTCGTNSEGYVTIGDCYVIADAYIGPEGAPPANFTLTYQSNPIAVPCTVNGQTLNPNDSIQVPSGTPVTISIPSEVTV